MPRRVTAKWRPPLILVLGGALVAVLALPLLGLIAVGLLEGRLGYGRASVVVALAVCAATLLLAFLLWRLLYGPITALAARARAVAAGPGEPAGALAHYGTAEMGELGQSFLEMTSSLRNREAAIRSFTDHAAHELKAPLTGIRGAAELLASGDGLRAEDRRLAETILAAAERMERELAALRCAASAREPAHHGLCRLDDLLPALQEDFAGLELAVAGGSLGLPLGAEGMRLVLTQLLRNAHEHGAERVALAAALSAEGPVLTVRDDGAGISEGNRERVFDPFFTTRRDSGGTGMGLAIVAGLLRAHGGTIRLLPGPGGAAFEIAF
jgi:two-component system OmpR family sensor kinase